MELSEEQKNRILRGAALLDEKVPDWYNRVNATKFDINSFKLCILCQVFGSYYQGLETLGWMSEGDEAPAAHGFYPYQGESFIIPLDDIEASRNLEEELVHAKNLFWIEQINQRRAAKCTA